MAYSHSGQPLLTPRASGVVDDIFCIFEGILDNVVVLRQQYGLNKSADEVAIIIEAYRTLRDKGPYRADEVIRDLLGKFVFVLYDSTSEAIFTADDADDSVTFFWGTAADDYLVLFDEPNVLKEGCGKSFAPFPRGCHFPTSGGLQRFEHPLNKLMPMPRVDSAFGNRRISSSSWVESSHGKLITNTSQECTYDNLMTFQALGEQQIVNQTIATNSKVIVEVPMSTLLHRTFPSILHATYLAQIINEGFQYFSFRSHF